MIELVHQISINLIKIMPDRQLILKCCIKLQNNNDLIESFIEQINICQNVVDLLFPVLYSTRIGGKIK